MNKYLRVQGKVAATVLQKLGLQPINKKLNTSWFFIDYANASFKKGASFDVVLSDTTKKIEKYTKIKLLQIVDQFGIKHTAIPDGFKTICLLEFVNEIVAPISFRRLPNLLSWDVAKKPLLIANTKDITFDIPQNRILQTLKFEAKTVRYILRTKGYGSKPLEETIILLAKDLQTTDKDVEENIQLLINADELKSEQGLLI